MNARARQSPRPAYHGGPAARLQPRPVSTAPGDGPLPLAPTLLTKLAPSQAIPRRSRKNANLKRSGLAGTTELEGSGHAAEPPTARRIARHLARARRGE